MPIDVTQKTLRKLLQLYFDVRLNRRFDEPACRPAGNLPDIFVPRPRQQTPEGIVGRFAAAAAIVDEAINRGFVDRGRLNVVYGTEPDEGR